MSDPAFDGAMIEVATGCPVFPVRAPILTPTGARCSCKAGASCPVPGKHPHVKNWTGSNPDEPVGYSTDPAQIRIWAAKWPGCNWGGITGKGAGRIIIELDLRAGGDDGIAELERIYGPLPETRTYRSGSGGTHYVFKYPADVTGRIPNSASVLAIGVDVRGDGGMGILPGSLHKSGNRYELVDDLPPADVPAAWLPLLVDRDAPERARSNAEPYDGPRAQITPIMAGCAFMAHARDDAAMLSEPEWFAALSIAANTEDGIEAAHQLSEAYPLYSYDETQAKAERAQAVRMPMKCETIAGRTAGRWCDGCQHRGRIESPIVLGLPRVSVVLPGESVARQEPVPANSLTRRPFPVDCLPPALRDLATGAQSTLGIPGDYVATAGLAVIATAAGNALELEIKRGWKERPQLWAGIIGNPGTTKSPAIDVASRPLSDLQAKKRKEWSEAYAEWAETPKAERGPAPQLEIVEATDSTIEGLARALEHSRGVLAKADELTSWIAGHNRYRGSNASERGEYLKLWAGGNITAVRSTRVPLVIERPMAALIGGIQPARLVALAGDRPGEFINDGMLDRFLVAWPEARPAQWTEAEMTPGIIEDWAQLVNDLRAWKPVYTAVQDGYDVVRLTTDAKRLWQRWHDSNIDSIESAQGLTRGWASKAPRHLLRVCLVLHAAGNPSEPYRDIHAETLESAIELVEWFREQHGLMLSALNIGTASATAGLTGRIMRAIGRSESQRVSRADLLRALGNVRASDLTAALETPTAAGELTLSTVPTASKPREEYSYPVEQFELSNNLISDANEKVRKFESSNQVQNEISIPDEDRAALNGSARAIEPDPDGFKRCRDCGKSLYDWWAKVSDYCVACQSVQAGARV